MKPLRFSRWIDLRAGVAAGVELPNGKPRRFAIEAYDGGLLPVEGFEYPVVVALDSLEHPESMPLLIDHQGTVESTLGCTDKIENSGQDIRISGPVTATSEKALNVVAQSDKGQRWQASIGVRPSVHPEDLQKVRPGQRAMVNNQQFDGPFLILRNGQMYETSVLPAGADQTTRVNLAAKAARLLKGNSMLTFEEFVADGGFDLSIMTEDQRAFMTLLYDAHNNSAPPEPTTSTVTAEGTTVVTAAGPDPAAIEKAQEEANQGMLASIRKTQTEELQRIAAINGLAGKHPKILQAAIAGGWDPVKTENAVLKEDAKIQAPISRGGITTSMGATPQVLEAAICQSRKIPGFETQFEDKTLQAAHTTFGRSGIGLQQLLLMAAAANGYSANPGERVSNGNLRTILRAAFPGSGVQAAFSTTSLPGVLSNVANKELLAGYEADEQLMLWRLIAEIKSVSDFKTPDVSSLKDRRRNDRKNQGQSINENGDSMRTETLERIRANARRCKAIARATAREADSEAGKALYVERVLGLTRPANVQNN